MRCEESRVGEIHGRHRCLQVSSNLIRIAADEFLTRSVVFEAQRLIDESTAEGESSHEVQSLLDLFTYAGRDVSRLFDDRQVFGIPVLVISEPRLAFLC